MKRKTFIRCTAIILSIIGISSCNSYFRTITTINADGSCTREIYAVADSVFLAGDMSKSPYLFKLDSSWKIIPVRPKHPNFKGQEAKLQKDCNVKVSKTYSSVNNIQASVRTVEEELKSIAAPGESLKEIFFWFYTYHTYTVTYKNIAHLFPVSIDKYLSKKEQRIWFQGDLSSCKGMNGMELQNYLSTIETEVQTWYNRNVYELSFECIRTLDSQKTGSPYLSQLSQIKDSLFHVNENNNIEKTASFEHFVVEDVSRMLDTFFHTSHYSQLLSHFNEKEINRIYPQYQKQMETLSSLLIIFMDYELVLPGRCIETNASSIKNDTLAWKVDFPRFFAEDYVLTAQYKTINYWAFVVTGLLIVFSLSAKPLYNLWKKNRKCN